MRQVFFSHSSKDQDWVDWIAREVESLGVRVYLAQHDPKPGDLLSEKVRREIANSDVVMALLTLNAYASPYVQQEIGVATEQGKLIIPLVHPDLEGSPLAMLDGLEYIPFDFHAAPSGSADLIRRLRELATQAEQRIQAAEQAARKAQREHLIEGIIVATLVLGVVYLAIQSAEGPGTLISPRTN